MSRSGRSSHSGRVALVLGAVSIALVASPWIGGRVGEWLFVLLSLGFPAALGAFAARGRATRRLWLATAVVLEVSGVSMLVLSGRGVAAGMFGLPPASVAMLVGLGLVPLVLIGLGFPLATHLDDRGARSDAPRREESGSP